MPLSPRAFDCLVYLIEHRDRAVGKDELVSAIWGRPNVSDTQLGQAVLRARRAVGDDGQIQQIIRTVARYGYQWIADVEAIDASDAPTTVSVARPGAASETGVDIAAATIHSPAQLPAPRTRSPRRRGLLFSVAAVLLVLAVALALRYSSERAGNVAASANAIVLPLQVEAQAGNAWLRLGAMDLIADRLRAGGESVPPSEEIVALVQATHARSGATDPDALRRLAPTALLVSGTLQQRSNVWNLELQAVAADGAALKVESSQPDPLAAAREAADRLLGRLGRAHPAEPKSDASVQERLQRAQAAMLANDLDGARAILIGDAELARTEPQLEYRLAQVDLRAGEYARAEVSLTALLNEPSVRDPLFHARVLNGLGAAHIRQDDFAAAEKNYDAAIGLLRGSGHAAEFGLALTGRGVSRSMRHDFSSALADLGEARAQLESAGDALAVARVDSNLGGLEMMRDRPEQALPYLESAAQRFETYAAINELMETLESLVSTHLALLQPIDALEASDRSWTLAERTIDPNQRMNLVLDRVDVFLALGRLREAGQLLAGLPASATNANPFLARRLPALRGRLAFVEGRFAEAAAMAKQALGLRAPADDSGEGVAEIALLAQRAQLASAGAHAPDSVPAQDRVPLDAASVYPVQAVLEAERADAGGDNDGAERNYRAALDLAERHGVPADVALVSASYGAWLLRQNRLEQASEIIGRVSPWADRDFDCALLQLRLFHALGNADAWASALRQARLLAGERSLPDALSKPPS